MTLDPAGYQPGMTGLMTTKQVATLLACSARHVSRLVDRRAMPAPIRLGHLLRFDRAHIDAWVRDGCPDCRQRAGGKNEQP